MDAPPRGRATGNAVIVTVVVVAAVGIGGYRWGRAPVDGLEEQLEGARRQAAAGVDEQEEDETHLDAARVLLIEGLAETEGRSREIAEEAAADSYALGVWQTCRSLLGETDPECDARVRGLVEPTYPGDPGYIPREVERDIMSIGDEFKDLVNGLCTRDAWPYRVSDTDFQTVREACRSYGSMVGRELAD